jgi:hypothetical protein
MVTAGFSRGTDADVAVLRLRRAESFGDDTSLLLALGSTGGAATSLAVESLLALLFRLLVLLFLVPEGGEAAPSPVLSLALWS